MHPDSGCASSSGFTLLELLVVLTIASLVVALVPPAISAAVPGARLSNAARELTAALRDAHYRAVSRADVVDVEFEFEPSQYRIADGAATKLPGGIELSISETGTNARKRPPATTERVSDEAYRLSFYPDGSSSGATIKLAAAERQFLLDVGWPTGRVSITEGRTVVQ